MTVPLARAVLGVELPCLRLFNTLGRRLEEFAPRSGDAASMYTCGPTVYAYPHIGNLRAYVCADALRRTIEWLGTPVRQIVNITDVGHLLADVDIGDDKLEEAARRERRSVWDLAAYYTSAFFADVEALRIAPAEHYPRATGHVPQMIEFAAELERRGYGYRLSEGLFFDTGRVADYGKLALLDREGLREGARIAPVAGKRNPTDFALWRSSPPGERRLMEWDSPWGPGAPGWHLECSVMSIEYLGEHFDLHTGGIDHIPVHHTNEIAQSEAYLGDRQPWVRYWLHSDFVIVRDAKMAKSEGTGIRLDDLGATGVHPLAYRFLVLGAHYRSKIDFSSHGLEGAARAHRRLIERLRARVAPNRAGAAHGPRQLSERAASYLRRFGEALADDLGTPQAIAVLTEASRDAQLDDEELAVLVAAFDDVLQVGLTDLGPDDLALIRGASRDLTAAEVAERVTERTRARAAGDFATADRIRDELIAAGVEIADTPTGTTWTWR